jgi:hypothetical protein
MLTTCRKQPYEKYSIPKVRDTISFSFDNIIRITEVIKVPKKETLIKYIKKRMYNNELGRFFFDDDEINEELTMPLMILDYIGNYTIHSDGNITMI